MQILCISNGHGEDVIAIRIVEQLQHHLNSPTIVALPLVGQGHAYTQSHIPIIGPVQQMPSGGFIYMDGRELWKDVQGGLVQLTLAQYQVIRQWGQTGGTILAVGDIVPLFLAWLSGADYGFVGTAKSEYYLRDEKGWLPKTSWLERWFGSVYLPWERWLLRSDRTKAVFPRDTLTTKILQQWSIPAFDLGNPMMDGIERRQDAEGRRQEDDVCSGSKGVDGKKQKESLNVLLLPGSRMPEAQYNWQIILRAVAEIIDVFQDYSVVFMAAIAPAFKIEPFQEDLLLQGWNCQPIESVEMPIDDPHVLVFTQKNAHLLMTQNAYRDSLLAADLAIAMAGTATEQFVGLGKPAITIPGKGPQFTYAFAEAQTRLLGSSVILVESPQQVASVIQSLLADSQTWQLIAENGKRRMGRSGAAQRIANCFMQRCYSG